MKEEKGSHTAKKQHDFPLFEILNRTEQLYELFLVVVFSQRIVLTNPNVTHNLIKTRICLDYEEKKKKKSVIIFTDKLHGKNVNLRTVRYIHKQWSRCKHTDSRVSYISGMFVKTGKNIFNIYSLNYLDFLSRELSSKLL